MTLDVWNLVQISTTNPWNPNTFDDLLNHLIT